MRTGSEVPTTPGSVIRATVFGIRRQLFALTSDALDPADRMPWTSLDVDTVGEIYVGVSQLSDIEILFDAAGA